MIPRNHHAILHKAYLTISNPTTTRRISPTKIVNKTIISNIVGRRCHDALPPFGPDAMRALRWALAIELGAAILIYIYSKYVAFGVLARLPCGFLAGAILMEWGNERAQAFPNIII